MPVWDGNICMSGMPMPLSHYPSLHQALCARTPLRHLCLAGPPRSRGLATPPPSNGMQRFLEAPSTTSYQILLVAGSLVAFALRSAASSFQSNVSLNSVVDDFDLVGLEVNVSADTRHIDPRVRVATFSL